MLHRSSVLICFVTLAGSILGASSAGAQTTWYVDDDAPGDPGPGDPSVSDPLEDGSAAHPFDAIQEGIDASVDGDTVLVLDGTYTGAGNKNLDFVGRLITVRSENGPDTCVIDCEDDGRGFYFHSGETADAAIVGLTVKNGYAYCGGAVHCYESSPRLIDCMFLGNREGAVCCEQHAHASIVGCTIVANSRLGDCTWPAITGSRGCNITVSGCLVAANGTRAIYTNPEWYGEPSSAVIMNCTIVGNLGGGVGSSDLTLINCLIAGNTCAAEGCTGVGGVSCTGYLIMANCTISGNRSGGIDRAVWCWGDWCIATISNSILWGNSPWGEPEITVGHYEDPGAFALTLAHNDVQGGLQGVELRAENSTLVWNPGNINADPRFVGGPSGTWTADALPDPDAFQMTFTDASAAWGDNELIGKFINADLPFLFQLPIVANTATTITVWANPVLWLMRYGDAGREYEIYDYRLQTYSDCIDAACNCAVPPDVLDLDGDGDTDEYRPFDLDGEGRFFDDPATDDTGSGLPPIVDMGAYEFGGGGEPPCRGDLDGDRAVGLTDLARLLANFGMSFGANGADGDMDCDGDVEVSDLEALLSVYGTVCE